MRGHVARCDGKGCTESSDLPVLQPPAAFSPATHGWTVSIAYVGADADRVEYFDLCPWHTAHGRTAARPPEVPDHAPVVRLSVSAERALAELREVRSLVGAAMAHLIAEAHG